MSAYTLYYRSGGRDSRLHDCRGERLTPRNKEPPTFGGGEVSSAVSSEELEFDYNTSSI